jgi:hypothetical protein
MKIVAFLQNPGFSVTTPDDIVQRYADDIVFRRERLAASQTGARLMKAWGEDWYQYIYWDNACTTPGTVPLSFSRVDRNHIIDTILREEPDIVLAYGRYAERMMKTIPPCTWLKVFVTQHTNCHGITSDEMKAFANGVKAWIREHTSLQDHLELGKLLNS